MTVRPTNRPTDGQIESKGSHNSNKNVVKGKTTENNGCVAMSSLVILKDTANRMSRTATTRSSSLPLGVPLGC